MIALGNVSTLVLMHKSRLFHFCADIVFELCKLYQAKVFILEETVETTMETRPVAEMLLS